MKTIVIQIGNSDDKLSQAEWSRFWAEVENTVRDFDFDVHFSGGSPTHCPWQNHCWVAAIKESDYLPLCNRLKAIREQYQQESVAVLIGETLFV